MSIIRELGCDSIAFTVQDIDSIFEYALTLKGLASELCIQMDLPELPVVKEYEDETGSYVIVHLLSPEQSLNYMDLFLDALSDPELDIDLDHLQAFTYNAFVQHRYTNAKHLMLSNLVYNIFSDLNEEGDISSRVLSLEQVIEYNAVPKLRDILNIMSHAMENNGIEVATKINEVSVPTIH